MARKRLGDLLLESGLINEQQLNTTIQTKSPDVKLGDALIESGYITQQQLAETLELQLGIPRVNLFQYPIDPEVIQLVPRTLAKSHQVIPIKQEDNKLYMAMSDPMDYFAIEEIRMATGCQIVPALATKEEVQQAIAKYYDLQETLEEALEDFPADETIDETGITDEDSPIVRLVNQIIAQAVTHRASDIHFDPQERELKVRYRVDGVLRTERALPKYMQNMIVARIKIMGNLNITESRIPQDGRMKLNINFKPVDIRLSTLPSVYGEKIVMRILDLSSALNNLDHLGFTEKNLSRFIQMIEKPNGIVLITGPTGSGKSSTLYAALNRLNNEKVNIITIEDPVEYQLEGINQVQVKEEVGMTFASGLRSILRQDPDIIMIGEIRDFETAQIAIRASLTGHLVLSTLHTNDTSSALTRLVDMGVEPFLISSSLTGVIAQRLVRRVCRDCGETVAPTSREIEIFRENGIDITSLKKGRGCPSCSFTGYRGRIAIHEVLPIDAKIRELVMTGASAADIHKYAKQSGMAFLIKDGLLKAAEGLTTTEEVLRVSSID